jgi:hypothetical protein
MDHFLGETAIKELSKVLLSMDIERIIIDEYETCCVSSRYISLLNCTDDVSWVYSSEANITFMTNYLDDVEILAELGEKVLKLASCLWFSCHRNQVFDSCLG